MRSSQLQRPVARFNKSKSKPTQSKISAEDRVHAFLSELHTTPIMTKPTKKINYSSKTLMLHTRPNKENMKPNPTKPRHQKNKQQKSQNKSTQNHTIQQRKTSISRPMYNTYAQQNHNNNRNRTMNNNSRSTSPQPNQNKIDQYSLSLQIKNSECEVLKNENKELKYQNMELRNANKELEMDKQKVFNLQQEFVNNEERIVKLESKLESCGIDPIALNAPEFMNEDIQKNIIFWRERLCKARQRLNDRKMKQKQIIQTAQYYIQRLH